MAALKKEAPPKSFFSSPSHTFKKLVNAFPKAQKQSHLSSQQQQQQRNLQQQQQPHQQKLAVDCEGEDDDEDEDGEDENGVAELDVNDGCGGEDAHKPISPAAEEDGVDVDNGVDDDTEYIDSSEGEYPRPRIREDLLPHDFSAWQKSLSIAPYPSSTSRDAETFSEVLSSSTSQDRHLYSQEKRWLQGRHHRTNSCAEYPRNPSHIEDHRRSSHINPYRNPSPSLASAMDLSPVTDLHLHQLRQNLPDLKLDIVTHGGLGGCRYGGPGGLKGFREDCWSVRNGASENGRRNSIDGSCSQRRKVPDSVVLGGGVREMKQDGEALYQNLVEMMPHIQTYREHQEDGHQHGNFQHHASMLYTLAPSREALVKKVADSMNSRRASRNMRRVKKKSDSVWEEQENLPRRVKANDLSCSPRRVSYENSVDIAKLQGQVEELQRKLIVRESVLQSHHYGVELKDESSEELLLLVRRVEELQRRVSEKDQMLELAKVTLEQKENDIQAMQRLLQDTEEKCLVLRARNTKSEEEVRALRCEVAGLRWQMEIDAERARSETEASADGNDAKCQRSDPRKQEDEPEIRELEAIRKMYLASLVVAMHVPREECLAFVGVLRIQLQHILRIPTFHLP